MSRKRPPGDRYARSVLHRVGRRAHRGPHLPDGVLAIVDAALAVRVGFVDADRPVVVPMACARDGESLRLHRARRSRFTEAIDGAAVCRRVAFKAMAERPMPGPWAEVAPPSPPAHEATEILRVDIDTASAKLRCAHTLGEPANHTRRPWRETWAGVVPVATAFGPGPADATVPAGLAVPTTVRRRPLERP